MAFKNTIDAGEAQRSLAAWLPTRVPGATDVQVTNVVIPSSNGLSCETVLFDATWREPGAEPSTRRLVARVAPRLDDDAPSLFESYDLELEAKIMRALSEHTDVPAPVVLFSETDRSVLGGAFLVMERLEGRVPPDDPPYSVSGWVLELEPAKQRLLVDNIVQVLVDLHAADWKSLGLQALDRRYRGAPGLDQYIANIEYLYETGAQGLPHPTIEAGIAWVKEHRPTGEGPMVLNWGDTRIGNLIYGDDLAVVGVLDWEMACIGSRDQDLAFLLFNFDFFTLGMDIPSPPGFPTEQEIVERYEALSGYQPRNLEYYKATSALFASVLFMRVGYLMIAGRLVPPDSTMPHSNPGSAVMATYMGLPAPSGAVAGWTGVR